MHACRLGASVAVLFVAEPVKGFEVGVATSATNEMLDAFRYNRFAEVAFAEKCRFFSMDGTVDELLVLAARVSRLSDVLRRE